MDTGAAQAQVEVKTNSADVKGVSKRDRTLSVEGTPCNKEKTVWGEPRIGLGGNLQIGEDKDSRFQVADHARGSHLSKEN